MKYLLIIVTLLSTGCSLNEREQHLMDTDPRAFTVDFIVRHIKQPLMKKIEPANTNNLSKVNNVDGYTWINKK